MFKSGFSISEATRCMRFVGNIDTVNNSDLLPGDVAIRNEALFLWDGDRWESLESLGAEPMLGRKPEIGRDARKLRNCKNCGAPAGYRGYCEYCGSTLFDWGTSL